MNSSFLQKILRLNENVNIHSIARYLKSSAYRFLVEKRLFLIEESSEHKTAVIDRKGKKVLITYTMQPRI